MYWYTREKEGEEGAGGPSREQELRAVKAREEELMLEVGRGAAFLDCVLRVGRGEGRRGLGQPHWRGIFMLEVSGACV